MGTVPSIDPNGGTGVLAVTTQPECAWDASSSADWISALAPATGQGTGNVSFRVAANEGLGVREGLIVVNGEQARVSQRAPCRYNTGPAAQTVPAIGGPGSMSILTSSDCSWMATADVSWITITSPASGSGNATLAFSVGLNDGAERIGSVSIGSQRTLVTQLSGGGGSSSPSPNPPVPPAPNTCTYSLSPTSDFVSSNEGSASFTVLASRSTCPWNAVSNATWILMSSGATGTGNGTVTYRVRNNTAGRRTGTLTVAGLTFTVTQAQVGGLAPPVESSSAR